MRMIQKKNNEDDSDDNTDNNTNDDNNNNTKDNTDNKESSGKELKSKVMQENLLWLGNSTSSIINITTTLLL